MNRRSFLRGLLALPLAPLAAKLLPEAPAGIPINHTEDMRVTEATVDYAASGSDQTSIYLMDWQRFESVRAAEDDKFIAKFTEQLISNRNWLKESIRGN